MLIAASPPRRLGSSPSRVRFRQDPETSDGWVGRRVLAVDDKPAFELSFWCGTCAFLFERLEGCDQTLSLSAFAQRLAEGLEGVDDDVVDTFGELLPDGVYLPLLLQIEPQLRLPSRSGDYFAEEGFQTWGPTPFWGLPENPRTAYYRTYQAPVTPEAHLFEFVVPMLAPAWNDRATVADHASLLSGSASPTAVAVSTLDVCAPETSMDTDGIYAHWGLTHFLLDGHHKVQAAAEGGRRLRLLSLLSVDASLATPEQVGSVPELRSRPAGPRQPQV